MKMLKDLAHYKFEEELIFFGGTFDPWHEGHEACLKLAPKKKNIFLVPDRNPFKNFNERPAEVVYKELESIIAPLNHLDYKLSLYGNFLSSNKTNPTYHWINEIHEAYPQYQLSLLMGYDSFRSLPQWIEAKKLLNILHSIYVVSRNEGETDKLEDLKEIEKINRDLYIAFLGHHDFEHLSSTEIRNKKGT